MEPKFRYWLVGVLIFLLGAVLFAHRPVSSAVYYSGYGRGESNGVQIELVLNPPVAMPGDTVLLIVRVSNQTVQSASPSIELYLPNNLEADMYGLPSGATFNLQANRIDWLPIIAPGNVAAFEMNALVQTADVLSPEQDVIVQLYNRGEDARAVAQGWFGIPPLIRDLPQNARVAVGQPIMLEAAIAGPGPVKITWDLGDGRRLDLAQPEVAFPAAGQYDILVEASNPAGRVSGRMTLSVLPSPVAGFHPDDDRPAVGQTVTFISTSGGQPPLNVHWDFGDGNSVTGEQQPVHTFSQAGTYLVRLVVENSHGRSEAFWPVTVGEPPIADLTVPDRVAVGVPLIGQAIGDESVIRYIWDMGDGRTNEGHTVSHFYRLPGDFYITLIADNGHGETRVGRWVRVEPGITNLFLPLAANQNDGQDILINGGLNGAQVDPAVMSLAEPVTLEPITFPDGTSPTDQLLAYLNAVRTDSNLSPLAYNYELSVAAQTHARDKANFPDNPHNGSDGTTSAERLLRAGYRGGYAGEATAWGFGDPRLAVEFWINSDTHRPLLLNRLATDVGVGYVEDYGTRNVWHWVAEFAVSYGSPVTAAIRQQLPVPSQVATNSEVVNYSWVWPLPLTAGERFTVYLVVGNQLIPLGATSAPVYGSRFVLSSDALTAITPAQATPGVTGRYHWLVRLEDGLGGVIAESGQWPISMIVDPVVPTPEATVMLITATPSGPTATPTNTPIPAPPTDEPPPDDELPAVITATPLPSPSP
jgi:uncharacterized protein YkwD/plastocyanin